MPDDEKQTMGSMMGGEPIAKTEVKVAKEDKSDEGGKKDNGGKKDDNEDDIEKHPTVEKLKKDLEDKGTNLSKQGKLIDDLKKEIDTLKKGKAPEKNEQQIDLPYKNIKRSKDLSKADLEDMTKGEIAQMDAIADLHDQINKMTLAGATKKETSKEEKEDEDDTQKPEPGTVDLFDADTPVKDLSKDAKSSALELAGGDRELANKIIVEFNQFSGNDALTAAQLKTRMEKAAKLVPDYKAPKEQVSTTVSKTVQTDSGGKKDVFGTDAIVEAASKKGKGSYSL